ncbi:MAG: NAD(P)-binding domain-containing protein [Armatimonadetes bacterium]|nr:NAD(P)-binding domain-containing protein [Armatimonadota bacterium]NIM24088.1 NAD(P)-binding domain-containing protein [Armatimonadota bacterium]NIM67942.1 NAD(P)-binding domain-containing protein [Armatimonadota bacterium]NIM76464.1 NAD(P)-binding domain-containing protein [Armatimonadota bacterium]NIN06172.1 NAD(P)-binding domain-containing protein [Armatimonadota bacterium]
MPKKSKSAEKPRFCVLGAGNGGMAMAAHLALKGFSVNLYNRNPDRLRPIQHAGGIQIVARDGEELPRGRGRLKVVSADIAKALDGVDVLMVTVPAVGHAFIAEQCAPHLHDGQVVVLHPGRTGGALEFHHILRQKQVKADVVVAEAQTFLYASRAVNPAQVQIFRIKNSVPVAAIPAYRTPEVIKAIAPAYYEFIPGDNVMKTSMDNIGSVFHPAVTVLNCARIESTHGEFEYYIDGITASTALILEALDAERVAVGAALGFNCMSAREWLYVAYDAAGKTLHEALRANPGYYGIKAPHRLYHRYLTEDVPMSLVPIASMGEILGVPCPTIKAIVHLANLLHQCDYWQTGRTAEKLGLAGLTLQQIRQLVLEGNLPEKKPAKPSKRRQRSRETSR